MTTTKKVGFFEELPNESSYTRLSSFIVLIIWAIIIIYQVIFQKGFSGFEFHVLLATAAFAPKVISKFAEMKNRVKSDEPQKSEV